MKPSRRWREIYEGGSAAAEQAILHSMAEKMLRIPLARSAAPGEDRVARMMYAKTVVGVTDAVLIVDRALPRDLARTHLRAGARFAVTARFSNASAVTQSDLVPDMRGVSLRIALPGGGAHDLVLASFPTAIARDARQFFELRMSSIGDRETLLARLAERIGLAESRRIAVDLRGAFKLCPSLALQRFWSGSAFLWGGRPVHFELRPTPRTPAVAASPAWSDDALRLELAARLATRDVAFRFAIQRYVDEKRTPIEDAAARWKDTVSRPVEIATVIIPRQDLASAAARAAWLQVDRTVFDPWNAPSGFRPLGSLNRLRRLVYQAPAIRDNVAQQRARTRTADD